MRNSLIIFLALFGIVIFSAASGHGIESYSSGSMPQVELSGAEQGILNSRMNNWAVQCGGSYSNSCFVNLIQPAMVYHMTAAYNWFNAVASYHSDGWQWKILNCTTTKWESPCSDGYAQNHFHETGFAQYFSSETGIPPN